MITYHCEKCGRDLELKHVRKRVFCPCGGVAANPAWDGQQVANEPQQAFGVGDAMAAIMSELGIKEKTNCSCSSLRQSMNRLGVDGCIKQLDWIVAKMHENASEYSWQETIAIAAKNLANPVAISIAMTGDIFSAMLNEAIARTTAKLAK